MSDSNFFQNNSQPPTEPTEPEVYTNIVREHHAQIRIVDGDVIDIPISRHESQPNEDGTYTDRETHIHNLDRDRTPINPDPEKEIAISHGGYIVDAESLTRCRFCHRIVKIHSDGISLANETVLCNRCARIRDAYQWILLALGALILIGFIKGLGWF